jgi:hypothetical protein
MALQKKTTTTRKEEEMDAGGDGDDATQKLLPFPLLLRPDPRSLQLQLWGEEEAALRRAADMEEELWRGGHRELRRLFATFAAFQGVLFSALLVLQQQAEREREAALPAMAMAALLSGGAAAMALLREGREVGALRRETGELRSRADAVYGLMESLAAGVFDLDAAADAEAAAAAAPSRRVSSSSFFFCFQGWDLLLYVACLTFLMLFCCTAILCTACSQTLLQP